jgi:pimeloyl-ACP methyl ester carboxylesterase
MFTENWFDTDSLRLNYAEGARNGPPIVVLHGIPNRWQGMLQLMTPLERMWHVFACDLRGHGKSGRASSYRVVDYSGDIAAFVKHRVSAPTVLLGHSGGAMAALGAAAQLRNLVRGVVLLDPPLAQAMSSSWPKSTSEFMAGICSIIEGKLTAKQVLAETLPGLSDGQIHWFADTFSCVDLGVIETLRNGHLFEDFDVEAQLAQLACPVLMLHGDVDKGALVRDSDVALFLSHLPNGKVIRIEDTGHYLHAQKPQEIFAALADWLRSNRLDKAS